MRADDRSGSNHPLAPRMAAIAFIAFNVAIGCVYGTFSVLMPSVEAQLGVSRAAVSLGVSLVAVAIGLLAPLLGVLAGRVSIRILMATGTALLALGFAVLAEARGLTAYLLGYALLIGPGTCAVGTVLPSTLVTRWFARGRGRALGLVHIPILVAILPLVATYMLSAHGLTATYLLLAAIAAVTILPMLLIVDRPPADPVPLDASPADAADDALPVAVLLRAPQFWTATLAFAALSGGAVLLAAHLFPMATAWGFSPARAATLLAIMSFAGMAGTPAFGWLADRAGGRSALAIAAIDSVFLWLLLLVSQPPYALSATVVALLGFHGGAIVPSVGMTLSQRFGERSYPRAFGLANLMNLPVSMLVVPGAALIFDRTGSYAGALAGQAALLLVAGVLLALVGPRRRAA